MVKINKFESETQAKKEKVMEHVEKAQVELSKAMHALLQVSSRLDSRKERDLYEKIMDAHTSLNKVDL